MRMKGTNFCYLSLGFIDHLNLTKKKLAFHLSLHYLLRQKQSSGTEMHHFIEILTVNPLNYKMDSIILIISICMDNPFK